MITVESNASTFAWGVPNTNAFTIATSVSNSTNYVIFAYEKAIQGLQFGAGQLS